LIFFLNLSSFYFFSRCRGFVFNVQHPIASVFLLLLAGLLQQLPQPVHLRQHQPRIQTGLFQDPVRSTEQVVAERSRWKTFQPAANCATAVSVPSRQQESVGGKCIANIR
jgi:hypothetical protein